MREHFNKREILDNLKPLVDNCAMRYNLIPLEVSLEKENGHWFLRVFIYCKDHPVSLQDCENLTRGMGDFLDELIPFKYYLEVSSPGLNRKLKSPREYAIFQGKDVILKAKNQIEGLLGKTFCAKLLGYDEEKGVILEIEGKTYFVEENNIHSLKLDEEITINNQNKGEKND